MDMTFHRILLDVHRDGSVGRLICMSGRLFFFKFAPQFGLNTLITNPSQIQIFFKRYRGSLTISDPHFRKPVLGENGLAIVRWTKDFGDPGNLWLVGDEIKDGKEHQCLNLRETWKYSDAGHLNVSLAPDTIKIFSLVSGCANFNETEEVEEIRFE